MGHDVSVKQLAAARRSLQAENYLSHRHTQTSLSLVRIH
jgi:hypothetical protein